MKNNEEVRKNKLSCLFDPSMCVVLSGMTYLMQVGDSLSNFNIFAVTFVFM